MKITILLRTKEEESLYRKVLLKIGSLQGEELYICSGTLTNISVDPSLFKSLKKGFSSVSDPKLVTLGMRESSKCQKPLDCECSFCKYKSLAMSLKRESLASGYSYKALMDKDKKWHSKIALKVRDRQN